MVGLMPETLPRSEPIEMRGTKRLRGAGERRLVRSSNQLLWSRKWVTKILEYFRGGDLPVIHLDREIGDF